MTVRKIVRSLGYAPSASILGVDKNMNPQRMGRLLDLLAGNQQFYIKHKKSKLYMKIWREMEWTEYAVDAFMFQTRQQAQDTITRYRLNDIAEVVEFKVDDFLSPI